MGSGTKDNARQVFRRKILGGFWGIFENVPLLLPLLEQACQIE
jgi:hypothetical protein